jgi:hypothetical protein
MIVGYVFLSIVGFLSHLSFATVFLPQAIWATVRLLRPKDAVVLLSCYLPTAIFLVLLWVFDLELAISGGGPKWSIWLIALEAIALPSGVADSGWLMSLSAILILVGLIVGLYICYQRSVADAFFFGLCVLLSFPLMFGMRSNGLLYSRHFIVVWTVLLPVLGLAITGPPGQLARQTTLRILITLVPWLATNGWAFGQFATYGRGGFGKSVDWLVQETHKINTDPPRNYWIGSNSDFPTWIVVMFYLKRYSLDPHLRYVTTSHWPDEHVDWVIFAAPERHFEPERELHIGNWTYDLAHFQRFAGPVGLNWAIYRLRQP